MQLFVPFEGGRLGRRAQGSRDRTSGEGRQDKDVLSARAPSTAFEPGTCFGEAGAGHPAGTMALVTLAETKVTRAIRERCYDSMPVSSAEPLSTPLSNEKHVTVTLRFGSAEATERGAREQ